MLHLNVVRLLTDGHTTKNKLLTPKSVQMIQHPNQPAPLKRATRLSKYTRSDYGRFPSSVASIQPAGHKALRTVEIDCRFLFSESIWGYMRAGGLGCEPSPSYPAGILYLDIDLRQPPDCKLLSATVAVTLEKDPDVPGREEPAIMTGHYGPMQLRGPEQLMQTRRLNQLMPYMEVANVAVGGLGMETEKTQSTTDRWAFSGHLRSVAGSLCYNKLEWVLDESFLEKKPSHGVLFHTGFAVGHNARGFQMTVEIHGKLESKWDKTKDWCSRKMTFRGGKDKQEGKASIKFQWSNNYHDSYSKFLDRDAQDLPLAMEEKNRRSVPIVIPGPQEATFHTVPLTEAEVSPSAKMAVRPSPMAMPPVNDNQSEETFPRLHAPKPPRLIGMTDTFPQLMSSTHENMARAAGFELGVGSGLPPRPDSPQRSVFSRGTTVVDIGQDSESPWESNPDLRRTMERNVGTNKEPAPKQTMKEDKISSDGSTMKEGILLGLLYWLQGVTIWELISAMLGVAPFPEKAVRMKIEDNKEKDVKVKNSRMHSGGQRRTQMIDESDTESPVLIASNRAWQNRKKEELELRFC